MKILFSIILFILFFALTASADPEKDLAQRKRADEMASTILLRAYPDSVDWEIGKYNQVKNTLAEAVLTYVIVMNRETNPLLDFIRDVNNEQVIAAALPAFRIGTESIPFSAAAKSLGPHPNMRSEFWQMSNDPERNKQIAEENWVSHYAATAFIYYYIPSLEIKLSNVDNSPKGLGVRARNTVVKVASYILPFIRQTDKRNDFLLHLLSATRHSDEFIDAATIYLFEVHQQNEQGLRDKRETLEQAWEIVFEMVLARTSFDVRTKSEFYKNIFTRNTKRPEFDFFKRQKEGPNPLTWLHQVSLELSPRWAISLSGAEKLRILPRVFEKKPNVELAQMLLTARIDNFRMMRWDLKLKNLPMHAQYLGDTFVLADIEAKLQLYPEHRTDLLKAAHSYPEPLKAKVMDLANSYSVRQRAIRFLKAICAQMFVREDKKPKQTEEK
jgi:hypothetical protein